MPFDSTQQRRIMGHFATGVTVVTTRAGAEATGLTVNAFASLSLDPPLVLVAIERKSHSYPILKQAGCYAVNFLTLEQEPISRRFATPGPKDFSGLEITAAVTGAPILKDALAYIDCEIHAIADGGDHEIFIGKIVAGETTDREPLLYFRGKYRRIADA